MSVGDPGPYINDEGDVWVPRTVPWREARGVAVVSDSGDPWQALHYIGKEDANLLGFTRDCQCEDYCCGKPVDGECHPDPACHVPAWHFRWVER